MKVGKLVKMRNPHPLNQMKIGQIGKITVLENDIIYLREYPEEPFSKDRFIRPNLYEKIKYYWGRL